MGLSRLSNFLKNVKGNIIYVDPNSLDSTDSVENQGNSLTRPFKTIQRALIEAARFSYQRGKKNDRFLKTTILLYPGEHYIDNRPGLIPVGNNRYLTRGGVETNQVIEWDFQSNFDILDSTNDLYILNSIFGGVIVPRGTSIVGMDLRKTKIRPLYVPNPENDDIERSAIFRVTGGCYFWQFTVLDGDPNGLVFKDYTANLTVPNFSHNKLTVFEYADGLNNVRIEDEFVPDSFGGIFETDRTDLDMYYEKIGLVYGPGVGRPISPDFPSQDVDIEPVVDEYRVVGSKGLEVGIGTIRSGNGIVGSTEITIILNERVEQLSVDTPIQISGVSELGYTGQYAVAEVIDDFTFKYIVSSVPAQINPNATDATVSITVDTVSSASPYIFNCSLRSVYGMCGLHADGSKATGFRSMVVAQYTGIGLQKDDNAFARYDKNTGTYIIGEENAHTNSLSRFRPTYENYHIKASNNAFLQLVSVFAIGFANHFLAESGGDHSITNSNSNFGAKSLVSSGFRNESFIRDDCGYITGIITPEGIDSEEETIDYIPIDVVRTIASGVDSRLYLANETSEENPPEFILNGYRLGSSKQDQLNVSLTDPSVGITSILTSEIVFSNTPALNPNRDLFNIRGEKRYRVGRSAIGINSITNNVIDFDSSHSFTSGESVRPVPISGTLPDGLEIDKVYFVNTDVPDGGIRQIKLSSNKDDAISEVRAVNLNNKGGIFEFVSLVSDKQPDDPGSPLQWDGTQWYLTVNPRNNNIKSKIEDLNAAGNIGEVTPKTFIKRKPDTRSNSDKIFKYRYVIPKENTLTCRPPIDGYVLQDSSSTIGKDTSEILKYYPLDSQTIDNPTELRNFRYISNATWATNFATITTELPHNLNVGSEVSIYNILSTNNVKGIDDNGFNGTFTVYDVIDSRRFNYILTSNPGIFNNNTSLRTVTNLPRYVNRRFKTTYQIFRSEEIQPYEKDVQDGIYHLTLINSSNNPSVTPFTELSFSQPIQNLYPQLNRDNPNSNPEASLSVPLPDPIGQVSINDPKRSITKETLEKSLDDLKFGLKIQDIQSVSGTAHTITTTVDHGLNGITEISVFSGLDGGEYSNGTYYNIELVGAAGSTTGTNATAVVQVENKIITNVRVLNPGSAYGIGNTLTPVGIPTESAYVPSDAAVLQVNSISNSVGSVIAVSGISSHRRDIADYNGYYVISEIKNGQTNSITVNSTKTINSFKRSLSGSTDNSFGIVAGKEISVTSFQYTPSTGIATVGLSTSHPFRIGSNVKIYGADSNFFNDKNDIYVNRLNSPLSLRLNVGKTNQNPVTTGSLKIFAPGFNSSNLGEVSGPNEFKSSRLIYNFANYTGYVETTLQSNGEGLQVYDSEGLSIGDFLLVGNEIFRIKSTVISNSLTVERALLGTRREQHLKDSLVKKIIVNPVEFRRNSIIRASGHTFEYLGFGPGNYSTGLPERQDRVLSPQEEILSQATKIDGGTIQYTGMNSDGDFYNNNRKLTSTGKDQIFEAPIPTVTGEEPLELKSEGGYNLSTPEEIVVGRSIQVNGGPNSKLPSKFGGPAIFEEKVTSTSDLGVELRKIAIKGNLDVSREINISDTTPTSSANLGDVVLNGSPEIGGNVGWIYAVDPDDNKVKWQEYGWINDALYGVDFSSTGILNAKPSRLLNFVGSGINIATANDENSGVSTVTFSQSVTAANKVGIATGSLVEGETYPTEILSGTIPDEVLQPVIKFVGDPTGFGVNIVTQYPPESYTGAGNVGVVTVSYQSPLVPINLGDGTAFNEGSGFLANPTSLNRSPGTRIIYQDSLSPSLVDYAVGRSNNYLWWSVPSNQLNYGWRWYGGEDQVLQFTNEGLDTSPQIISPSAEKWEITSKNNDNTRVDLILNGLIQGYYYTSTATGTIPPFVVSSSALVSNLNANFVNNAVPNATNTTLVSGRNTIPIRQNITGTGAFAGNTYSYIQAASEFLISTNNVPRSGSYFENLIGTVQADAFSLSNGGLVDGVATFSQISDLSNYVSNPTQTGSAGDPYRYIATLVIESNFENGSVLEIDGALPTSVTTLNIINVPTTANRTYNYTVVIESSTGTGLPYELQINGNPIPPTSINWLNGTIPSSSVGQSGIFVVGFTFFSDSAGIFNNGATAKVLGVFGSYSN